MHRNNRVTRRDTKTDALLVRTNLQRPTSTLRLRRDVRVEFERARAGRVEEAARQTSVAVERVGRAGLVARRTADVLVRDLFAARRADESDAKERGLLGRVGQPGAPRGSSGEGPAAEAVLADEGARPEVGARRRGVMY